ncbi:sperm-associated antigen 5 isoform X2 [Hoplias malabaricus]|uniref:sperm-associated antigen 5 isoform X2 n=1 Tax=Hoplias malabaricus TaxID=27720 RepID=UPI0034618E56
MSTIQTQPLQRSDRTPLREVQNELVQRTQGVKAAPSGDRTARVQNENLSLISSVSPSVCRSEEAADVVEEGHVMFKSMLCSGGDIEISEGSEMSEESVLVRDLMLEVGGQTLHYTTLKSEEDNVVECNDHTEHPYCSAPPGDSVNTMQDGNMNGVDRGLSLNGFAVPTNDESAVPLQRIDSSQDPADVTFKSFICPGGEVVVVDGSFIEESSIMAEDKALEAPSQSFLNESDNPRECSDLPASPGLHTDHPYFINARESSRSSAALDASQTADSDTAGQELQHSFSVDTSISPEEHGDITYQSLTFSGPVIELENTHKMSDISMLMKNLTISGHLQSFPCDLIEDEGESTAAFSPDGKRSDHLYCHVEERCMNRDGATNPLVPENKSHLRSQLSSTGLLESSEVAVAPGGTDGSLTSRLESVISESLLAPEDLVLGAELSEWSQNPAPLEQSGNPLVSEVNVEVKQGQEDQQSSKNENTNPEEDVSGLRGFLTNKPQEEASEIRKSSSENEDVGDRDKSSCTQADLNMSALTFEAGKGKYSQPNCEESDVEGSKVSEINIYQQLTFKHEEHKAEEGLTAVSGRLPHESVEAQSEICPSPEKTAGHVDADENVLAQKPESSSSSLQPDVGLEAECRNVLAQSQHLSNKVECSEVSQSQVNMDQPSLSDNEDESTVARKAESCLSGADGNLPGGNLSVQFMPTRNTESSSLADGNIPAGVGRDPVQNTALFPHHADQNLEPECGNSIQNLPAQRQSELTDSVVQDSALGLSSEVLRAESVSEFPAEVLPQLWSALTLNEPSTPRNRALSRSPLQDHAEGNLLSRLWPELPESPIPPPQFNSTTLTHSPTPAPVRRDRGTEGRGVVRRTERDAEKEKAPVPVWDFSTVGKGPLQQQLRQMAELLILASGKIAAPPTPAAAPMTPVQRRSAAVWTSPVLQTDHSVNTSALVEVVKEVEASDACTSTDSLLWSVSPDSLQSLSRSELEQKLLSTLIMVEILSQQLSSCQSRPARTGTAPSELRNRVVQTEHSEFSQTEPYRDLYFSALQRIQTLEQDPETLQTLTLAVQHFRSSMISVKSETEGALLGLRQIEGIVKEDQETLYKQVGEMKALYSRCVNALRRMEEKCRSCLQERDGMRRRMEETLQEKETVLRVLEQLRVHHSTQVSDLQRSLGSQQELTAALTQTYPQLVEMNRWYVEAISGASALLRENLDDHHRLSAELHKAQQLLQKTKPVLQKLQQRTLLAVEQSCQHHAERDRAVQEKAELEGELEQVHCSLQDAEQQITDLNTQITIMNSEMCVLREQLGEVEEERSELQKKSTELSATVSSTLASYVFLEQALASETSKLQRSLQETQEATGRAESLRAELDESQRKVEEMEQVLSQRDALLNELQTETENQRQQLRRLSQIQTELSSTREMSEFLQAENEATQEQLVESETLLRSHLQSLRERNLECEDLRLVIQQLRTERHSLQEELDCTRDKARVLLLEQGEQMAQATLDISLLQHTVRCLTNSTHTTAAAAKSPQRSETQEPDAQPQARQPCGSFVSSVMLALTEEPETAPPADTEVCPDDSVEGIGSKSSAFTRLSLAPQHADEEVHSSTTLTELLASLGDSVTELQAAVENLKRHKDSEIENLQKNIVGLQEALEAESDRYRAQEAELEQQVSRLRARVEKDALVLQQKAQDEKAQRKLCSELEESMETAQKHRAEISELRREGVDLRRSLQQSQMEVQALRAALNQSGDQSAVGSKELEERIRLLREVEKLKAKVMEVEESRTKLLERAKRHQMVHALNQSKCERELHLLDDMIEKVRKTLSSVPEVVKDCPELQRLVQFLG